MRRGSLGHAVLERTLRGLKAAHGLRAARRRPRSTGRCASSAPRSASSMPPRARPRGKAAARALEVDLERYIRHEAATGAGYEPAQLEWSFDALHDRRRRGQRARRPRSTSTARRAIVRDYKGRTVHPGARWAEDGRIQAALYALAVREQSRRRVVGALYQPIGTADQRPRGVVRDDVPGRYVNGDVSRRRDARGAPGGVARDRRPGRRRPARRPHQAVPGPLRLQRRLRPPGDLPLMTGASPPSSARRSRPAPAPRCWPRTPARARPR